METLTTTLEEQDPSSDRSRGASEALALVVAWCADAPWRTGEIAWLPIGATAEARVFGRGGALADDPHPRLTFIRQLPTGPEAAPAFLQPTLSRVQLIVSSSELDHVRLQNIGRCRLFVGGEAVREATLAPGHAAQLGQQLLLLCVRRTVVLPEPSKDYPRAPFGTPDGLGIVGESPAIWTLRQQLGAVALRPGHVLLLGPSGSGKELAARGIHALSKKTRPLVARNAATIPETLIDAELFGNARNYPNSGMAERPGLLGQADQSTLFLDEVAELPLALQAHLLRVLDQGEYHRLGDSVARRSNVRLVAATHRPISELRADLLARFAFRIEVPDLNSRREDIPLLIRHVLRQQAQTESQRLDPLAEEPTVSEAPETSIGLCRRLVEHTYTTHMRELERLLLQSIIGGRGDGIESARGIHNLSTDTELGATTTLQRATSANGDAESCIDGLSPHRIQAVLDAHNGRIEAAYRALGLKNRFVLGRLMAKYGLEVRRVRPVRTRKCPSGDTS